MASLSDESLKRGIGAARDGQPDLARRLLARGLLLNPGSEQGWLWLGWVTDGQEDRARILRHVLEINPSNRVAILGLRSRDKRPLLEAEPARPRLQTPEVAERTATFVRRRRRGIGISARQRPGRPAAEAVFMVVRRLQVATSFLLALTRRAAYGALNLLALVLLVSISMNLGIAGGLHGSSEAAPAAIESSRDFITGIISGDLALFQDLLRLLPKSLGLLTIAVALGVTIGLVLGSVAALRRNTRLATLLVAGSFLGISTPSYVAAMFLIWGVVWIAGATNIRLLPVFGFGWDSHLVLPVLVLSSQPMAYMTRLTHSTLLDVSESDYVRTAHSKGLQPLPVFWRHILPNAGVPLLTTAGVSFRLGLAMLPIVEFIFSWRGIGLEVLLAVQAGDLARVIVMASPLVVAFSVVNIALDFLNEVIDPRLRSVE